MSAVQARHGRSFYQVATLIPAVYHVSMPTQVADVLNLFRVAIEIDAWGLHFSCYGLGGLYYQLVFLMVWPVIAIAATPPAGRKHLQHPRTVPRS